MRNQDYYKKQYQLQKEQFELKRRTKIDNISKSLKDLDSKLQNLNARRQKLESDLARNEQSSFPSYEEFFRKIQEQAVHSKQSSKKEN